MAKKKLLIEIGESEDYLDNGREVLAKWHTELEKKEHDLQVREELVNQRERSHTKNYDLLNM